MKSLSKEDIHSVHNVKKKLLYLLANLWAAIVFQPTAQASAARTKTNLRPTYQLWAKEGCLGAQCMPNGCLHTKVTSYNFNLTILRKKVLIEVTFVQITFGI